LPPSHKLSFAIVLLILSLISPPIVQGLISIWVFIWIVCYAAIPANIYLKLLALPLSFWIASLPAFVINGADVQTQAVMVDVWRGLGMSLGRFYIYVSDYGLQ
jgi:cobalt/nickel transport system permease protein